MRWLVAILVIMLSAAPAGAADYSEIVSSGGWDISASFGSSNTYATHFSEEWTPTADAVVCQVGTYWGQVEGGRTYDIAVSIREGMTSNPETGGTVIATGIIYAADIPVRAVGSPEYITIDINPCFFARTGTAYGIDFSSGMDASHRLYAYYKNSDTITGANMWDYVPVSGWTERSTREMGIALYGTLDADSSLFSAYASSSYAFTDPDFGWFGNAMSDVFKWLFVPSDSSKAVLTAKKNDLLTKMPFGWFEQASSTVSGLTSGVSTTSSSIYLSASTTAGSWNVEVFNASSTKNTIPSNVRTLIRTLGGVAIWALFFTWLVALAIGKKADDEDV